MKENIILIGFMGCGKTTYGKKLARTLKKEFVDTDVLIEQNEGIDITEIFKQKGEDYFRQEEARIAEALSSDLDKVIATGGGMIKSPENMQNLKKTGIVIYLKSTPIQILKNLKNNDSRPLLQGENKLEKIEKLMEERVPLYEKYADIKVEVNENGIRYNTERIIEALEGYYEGMYNSRT